MPNPGSRRFAQASVVCDKCRVNSIDYLDLIRRAQVYDVADETPLELAANLSERLGNRVLMKREDLQPVFSFKLRGAYNKIAGLSEDDLGRGVICSSALGGQPCARRRARSEAQGHPGRHRHASDYPFHQDRGGRRTRWRSSAAWRRL
jgi:hypothetical protein